MSHPKGHMERGPQFKVSSKRLQKLGINLAISGLVFHYTTTDPKRKQNSVIMIYGHLGSGNVMIKHHAT